MPTTYNPNDTGCAGWEGSDDTRPPGAQTMDSSASLGSGDLDTISTDDSNSILKDCVGYVYPGHRVKFQIAETPGNVTQLDLTFKGYGAYDLGGNAYYLYVWDDNAGSWEQLDSHSSGSKDTVTGSITTNITNYIYADGGNNYVDALVMGPLANSAIVHAQVYTYYGELVVTATGGTVPLSGTVAAQSGESADLTVYNLRGTVAAASSLTGDLTTGKALSGTISATSSLGGDLLPATLISGAIVAEASAGGSLTMGWAASGTVAAEASLSGALSTDAPISGSIEAKNVTIGHLLVIPWLKGTISASSGESGALEVTKCLAGEASATASLSGSLLETIGLAGTVAAEGGIEGALTVGYVVSASVRGDYRLLTWPGAGTVAYVYFDGELQAQTDVGQLTIPEATEIRQYLQALASRPATPASPLDRVSLSWSDEGARYVLKRAPAGGSYEVVASLGGTSHVDGPLEDGTYRYKVVAYDEEDDFAESAQRSVTISSAPEPPSGLGYEWDAETQTLTLSWTASGSEDLDHYVIRGNGGSGAVALSGDPLDTTADTTWQQVFTDESGRYQFLVRAVDSGGIEEANVEQMVAIPFEDGYPVAYPCPPRIVSAEAVADGKIELTWLYDPAYEESGPGAGHEARIYWDDASGTVDYSAPKAEVYMAGPEDAAWWSWTSDALTDGETYTFVVRVATADWPGGIETENTDEHSATVDDDVPDAPELTATVI